MSFKRSVSSILSAALLLATAVMPVAPAAGAIGTSDIPAAVETPYAFVRDFPPATPFRHFVQPTDVAVTPDGDVLVVDKYYKKVLRYSSAGAYLASYAVAPTDRPAIDIPRRVVAAADGSFYVFVEDKNFEGDFRIVHCTSGGIPTAAWSGRGTAEGQFSGTVDLDMAVEADGNLVVVDFGGSRIVRFSPTGAVLGTLGSPGSGPGQLSFPEAVAVDDEGTVWVADWGNTRLQSYRSDGTSASIDTTYGAVSVAAHGGYVYYDDPFGVVSCVTTAGARFSWTNTADGYAIPVTAMTIAHSGGGDTLYACGGEGWNDGMPLAQVAAMPAPALTPATTWRSWGTGSMRMAAPRDVAVSTDTVLVAVPAEHVVKRYTRSGLYLGQTGGEGSGDGQFLDMNAIVTDLAGYTYVADNLNRRIEGFDQAMAFDGRRTLPVTATVADIDIDSENRIYVADDDKDVIRIFEGPSVTQTGEWGTAGNGAGQLNSPGNIALTGDGHIWVSDAYRVSKFTVGGTYTGISVCDHLSSATLPIAVDPEGRLVVRDTDNRLKRFHPDGTAVVEGGGPGFGELEFADPWGMDFGSNGHLYVADTYNDRVQELSPNQDTLPPVTTREGWDTWVPWEVSVKLNAVDGCAGVAETRYSLAGATTRAEGPYTGEFAVTTEGTTTITYYSIDASGHAEAPKTSYAKRDYSWPLITTSVADMATVTATSTVVKLTATDAYSGVDWIEWKLDSGPVTRVTGSEALVPVDTQGFHTIYYKTSDKCGNVWPAYDDLMFTLQGAVNRPPATPATSGEVAGADRFATGVQISKSAYPAGASTVVIASGRNFPDALGAAALAGSYDAPLLLVEPTSLPAVVKTEISRLGASRLIVIGGPPAVSDGVMAEATALLTGAKTAQRVSGPDRYATSKAVYDAFKARLAATGRTFSGTVIVASGANFPDALAASPLAAYRAWPILLTQPTALPAPTLAAIKDGTVKDAIVVGGPPAVSDDVQARLKTELGSTHVTRLSGPNRYSTALAIISRASIEGLHWDGVCIATGTNFADALAGGPYAAKAGTFVALTPPTSLDPDLKATLAIKKAQIGSVRFLGSTAAVTQPVRDAVMDALNR